MFSIENKKELAKELSMMIPEIEMDEIIKKWVDMTTIYSFILFLVTKAVMDKSNCNILVNGYRSVVNNDIDVSVLTRVYNKESNNHDNMLTVFNPGGAGSYIPDTKKLNSIEETAKYFTEIIHGCMLIFGKRISEIVKKPDLVNHHTYDTLYQQFSDANIVSLFDNELKLVVYSAALDTDIHNGIVSEYTINIATGDQWHHNRAMNPEFIKDDFNKAIVKDMWLQIIDIITLEMLKMVRDAAFGPNGLNLEEVKTKAEYYNTQQEALITSAIKINENNPQFQERIKELVTRINERSNNMILPIKPTPAVQENFDRRTERLASGNTGQPISSAPGFFPQNAELLRRLVPGVQATDYKVDALNIYNLALFLVAKQVNVMLQEDVLHYGTVFSMFRTVPDANKFKGFLYYSDANADNKSNKELVVEDVFDIFAEKHPLHNVEEVAEYIQNIMCEVIQVFGTYINEVTKKASKQLPKFKTMDTLRSYASSNGLNTEALYAPQQLDLILWNAAVTKELYTDHGYTKVVAPQLMEDEVSAAIIKTMWKEAVTSIYCTFEDMVMAATTGNMENPAEVANTYNDSSVCLCLPLPNEIKHSAVEEMIIQKILQEKRQEMKVSVG